MAGNEGIFVTVFWRFVCVLAVASLVAGCETLPAAGPLRSEISEQSQQATEQGQAGQFVLADIDDHVLAVLASRVEPTFGRRFGDYRPPARYTIGTGDGIVVTLWEAGSGGLFSAPMLNGVSTGSRSTVVPEQQVGQDGSITIPYAGRIVVRGKTTAQVEALIVEGLTGKAIQPQALVSVSRSVSNAATVLGEVTNGARLPLSPRGDRVLDVVATAGGIRSPIHETFIGLTRGKHTVVMPMQTLLSQPKENVYIRPQDTITVIRRPQTFTAFGATGQNTIVPFDAVGITLEEAVAKAGGLRDERADPRGVYLLRFEDAKLARAIAPANMALPETGLVRVIYRLDMRQASSMFLARQFKIRDKDVLYVANATSTDIQKLLTLFNLLTSPVIRGVSVANALD
jgi:polysaccharide export outer membrane protein